MALIDGDYQTIEINLNNLGASMISVDSLSGFSFDA